MDKPHHYYYGLCILDALDHETARTSGDQTLKAELRRAAYEVMSSTEEEAEEGMTRLQQLVNEYHGGHYASELLTVTEELYNIADTHLRQRMTGGPYDIPPEEFVNYLSDHIN